MLVGCEAVDVLQCALYGIISQCGSPYAIVPFLLFSSFSLSFSVLACLDVTVVTAVGIIHTVNMIYSWKFWVRDLISCQSRALQVRLASFAIVYF